jgi:hypothetical protein
MKCPRCGKKRQESEVKGQVETHNLLNNNVVVKLSDNLCEGCRKSIVDSVGKAPKASKKKKGSK